MTTHLNMKTINLPLLALFGLCYVLGHPVLSSLRPQIVDKTLASFHEDVNRTFAGSTVSLARLFEPEKPAPVEIAEVPVTPPVLKVESPQTVQPALQGPRKLAELPRQKTGGFIELMAR
jgi:hypothetical protein